MLMVYLVLLLMASLFSASRTWMVLRYSPVRSIIRSTSSWMTYSAAELRRDRALLTTSKSLLQMLPFRSPARSSGQDCRGSSACSASAATVGGDGGGRSPEPSEVHYLHEHRRTRARWLNQSE